jgi:hypothetical protein
MTIEVQVTCPLGSTCEKVVDGVIERCAWYVSLEGKNPQNGKEVNDSKCAIAWQPLLMIETAGIMNGTNASVQSLRNETVKRQEIALEVVKNAQISQAK